MSGRDLTSESWGFVPSKPFQIASVDHLEFTYLSLSMSTWKRPPIVKQPQAWVKSFTPTSQKMLIRCQSVSSSFIAWVQDHTTTFSECLSDGCHLVIHEITTLDTCNYWQQEACCCWLNWNVTSRPTVIVLSKPVLFPTMCKRLKCPGFITPTFLSKKGSFQWNQSYDWWTQKQTKFTHQVPYFKFVEPLREQRSKNPKKLAHNDFTQMNWFVFEKHVIEKNDENTDTMNGM